MIDVEVETTDWIGIRENTLTNRRGRVYTN